MGEDFLRKKDDRFRRHRDAHFSAELQSGDLFSAVAPECVRSFEADLTLADLKEGETLWQPDGEDGRFYRGVQVAARVDADVLSEASIAPGSVARVAEVDRDLGLVVIEVHGGLRPWSP